MTDPTTKERLVITDDWLTKAEVANRLGKSVTAVTRLQNAKKLSPQRDTDGNNRYDPAEVEKLLEEVPLDASSADRREQFAQFELTTVKSIISLVSAPREKIDALQFQIIEDLRAENKELYARLKSQTEEIEASRDNSAERTMAVNLSNSESKIKEMAFHKFLETVQRLLTGGKATGIQFTPKQLEELILTDEFLTEEQKAQAKASIMASATTKSVAQKMAGTEEPVKS
jgi:hypothetical protein